MSNSLCRLQARSALSSFQHPDEVAMHLGRLGQCLLGQVLVGPVSPNDGTKPARGPGRSGDFDEFDESSNSTTTSPNKHKKGTAIIFEAQPPEIAALFHRKMGLSPFLMDASALPRTHHARVGLEGTIRPLNPLELLFQLDLGMSRA
jgi:hypothetical protein